MFNPVPKFVSNPTLPKTKWFFDPSIGSIITEFQSEHGFAFTNQDASSDLNDVTAGMPFIGKQCVKLVTPGTGATATCFKTGLTAFDSTNGFPILLLRVEEGVTHLSSLRLALANDSGFTNEYYINFANAGCISPGQWIPISLVMSDAATHGSPTRSGITAVRVVAIDDNTGNKVTIRLGAIYFMPNGAQQPGNPFPKGVVSFSFDDGHASAVDVGKARLDLYGYRATYLIIKDLIGGINRITLPELKNLQDVGGHEVTAHSLTLADHNARLTNITNQQLLYDMASEKDWLMTNGLDGQGMAYPGGVNNQSVVDVVKQFFRYSRTTVPLTETLPCADPYRIKAYSDISAFSGGRAPSTISDPNGLIDLAVAEGAWLNLVFHRIIPTVSSVTMSGNIATVVFAGPHPFLATDAVTLAGFTPAGLNGNFTVASVVDSLTITINIGSNPGNGTDMGTILAATTDCDQDSYEAIVDKCNSSGILVLPMAEVISRMGERSLQKSTHQIRMASRGIIAETFPVTQIASNGGMTSQKVEYGLLEINAGQVVNNISFCVTSAPSGPSTNFFVGLFDKTGKLLATSDDLGTVADSLGIKTCALNAAVTITADDSYYAAVLCVTSNTPPQLGRGTSTGNALKVIGSGVRPAASQTGQATLPATATLGDASFGFWFAIS